MRGKSLDSGAALQLWRKVREAAEPFEGRWTLGALARVDAGLAQALHEQIQLWHQAAVTGTMADMTVHANGLARGYAKCAAVMAESGFEDDAYLIGLDTSTGCRVAIGDRRASGPRVHEVHGDRVVWMTPDEVARLWASIEGLRKVEPIKLYFPGAEIVGVDLRRATLPHTAEHMPLHPDEAAAREEAEE